jgi:C1A family cysteine protease
MIDTHEFGLGWQRDLPDYRDYTADNEKIKAILDQSTPLDKAMHARALGKVDLRQWCTPVENQGSLGSCTAHAAIGMVEYFQLRTKNEYLDGSRLFLYKVTRNLLEWTGDSGAYLRSTMRALVLFGVPPERYYPYRISDFEKEPPPFCYAFAQNYKAIKYFRLDPPGSKPAAVLNLVKRHLMAGLPSMFGFSVYTSMPPAGDGKGEIPFPIEGDSLIGGHAVLAVGFDDQKKIGKEKGALLIRNSWGETWGEKGYGWLPYAYIEAGLAVDVWSMVDASFVSTNIFQ